MQAVQGKNAIVTHNPLAYSSRRKWSLRLLNSVQHTALWANVSPSS